MSVVGIGTAVPTGNVLGILKVVWFEIVNVSNWSTTLQEMIKERKLR
jgi:hypothetical protein